MRAMVRFLNILLAGGALFASLAASSEAAPTAAEITGEIERLTLNNASGVYSGGVMIVGGTQVILPKNLLLDLPANRLTLQQLFDQASASCKANGESGLAKADRCNSMGAGGFATLSGVHSTVGNIIAGDVLIEKGKETASGVVSYISYSDGYFKLNGNPGDSGSGIMVRLNDPTGRHTVQQGAGCAGGPNCSADPRFTLDPDNYVNTFSTGYPFCIPSTVVRPFPGLPAITGLTAIAAGPTSAAANGSGDLLCPATNRTPGAIEEPPVADSRRFAPIMVGDSLQAEGNYEMVNGVRFLSAHTTRVNRALATRNFPDQPDYLFLEEVFLEAPGFQNQRARMLIIGFATLAPTDVDFWTLHRDPGSNGIHEFPLASIQGCDLADGVGLGGGACSNQGLIGAGANIFRIRYDVDFLLAAANDPKYPGGARPNLNPCLQLQASPRFAASNPGICGTGITLANNFGIMSPIPHEIQARTGHGLDNPGLVTLDIRGNQATNGQYLFPFGINLGGLETADFLEIDVNLLNTPRVFEGIPWNLDRRLSPSGCLKAGGCEATPQPLDPFPYTGLDPRLQAQFLVAGVAGGTPKGPYSDPNFTNSALTTPFYGASNRVFSYVRGAPFAGGKFNFDGNNTLLPYLQGTFPADPPLITILPTPVLSILPPVAGDDAATVVSGPGASVIIDVLANDTPILGNIVPASLAILSNPASGTVQLNADHTITYFPSNPFSVGSASFSYTVANDFGSVSLPGTVTVTILGPPAPAIGALLSPLVASPQAPLTPITFVASGSGGSGSYQYRFSVNTGGSYVVARAYDPLASWTWTPAATGAYDIKVDVRSDGSTAASEASATVFFYQIGTPATAVSIVPNLAAPQVPGTTVTFSATASGGSGPFEYRFWVNTGGGYTIAQEYNSANTFAWTPVKTGIYDILVDVRNQGSKVFRDALATLLAYQVAPLPATAVTLTSNAASPQPSGTAITFSATASGGTGPYEYRFWVNVGGTYLIAQDYSTISSWVWTPLAAGNYDIMVDTRAVGSATFREALQKVFFYQIQ